MHKKIETISKHFFVIFSGISVSHFSSKYQVWKFFLTSLPILVFENKSSKVLISDKWANLFLMFIKVVSYLSSFDSNPFISIIRCNFWLKPNADELKPNDLDYFQSIFNISPSTLDILSSINIQFSIMHSRRFSWFETTLNTGFSIFLNILLQSYNFSTVISTSY